MRIRDYAATVFATTATVTVTALLIAATTTVA
jgi:hypothetical protein